GFVGANHPRPIRQGQRLGLGGCPRRQERVVVEQEQRHDHRRATGTTPHRIRVLRGDDAETTAQPYQILVSLDASELDRVRWDGPEFVVTWRPDDRADPPAQDAQRPLDVGGFLRHITGHEQPVLRGTGPQSLDEPAVLRVADVKVADGKQLARQGGRIRHTDTFAYRGLGPEPATRTLVAPLSGGQLFFRPERLPDVAPKPPGVPPG